MTSDGRRLYADVDGEPKAIRHFKIGQISIADLGPMAVGAPLSFDIVFVKGEHALRVPAAGRVTGAEDGQPSAVEVAIDGSSRTVERLTAAAGWMKTPDPFPLDAFDRFGGPASGAPAGRIKAGRLAKMALLALACLALGSYVVQATAFSLNLQADSAYVAADTRTISVVDSGSVVFLNASESVVEGEPLLGVQTRAGSSKTFDAPFSGNVVARHMEVGDVVRQGDPIVTVASSAAIPYVVAYVTPADILKMGTRSRAIILLPGGRSMTVPVGTEDIFRRIDTEDGKDLIGIKINVDGLDPALIGRLVDVRFELDSLLNGLDLRL